MATYGSEAGVEGVNAHYVGGYTASTIPSTTQVATFLADGYALLNAALAKAGYTTPVGSTVAAYDILTRLNNLFAAACAEGATNISTAGPQEETRSSRLWQQYKDELGDFLAGDLTLLGLSHAATAPVRKQVRSLPLRHFDGYADYSDATPTTGEYTRRYWR